MIKVQVRKLHTAQKALDQAVKDVDTNNRTMLTVFLQAISANTVPYIPVDTSTLANSETRQIVDSPGGLTATIAYGADGSVNPDSGTPVQEYAAYVHDGPQKRWQKPGASNQFLTKGVRDFINDDLPGLLRRVWK